MKHGSFAKEINATSIATKSGAIPTSITSNELSSILFHLNRSSPKMRSWRDAAEASLPSRLVFIFKIIAVCSFVFKKFSFTRLASR